MDIENAVNEIGSSLFSEEVPGDNTGGTDLDLGGGSGNDNPTPADPPVVNPPKGEETPPPADPNAPKPDEVKTPPPTDPNALTPPPGPNDPPKSWRAEAQAKWSTLPPDIQQEILKREDDMHRGLAGYKEAADFGKGMQEVLKPYMQVLQHYNIDPRQQVGGLMQAHYSLAFGTPEARVQMIRQLCEEYKIDPAAVGEEPMYVDPQVKHLQGQLQAVQNQLSASQKASLEAQKQTFRSEIDKFAADPKNVHFDAVAQDMARLIQGGAAKTLADAYEMAVWQNPVTRAKEIAAQQAASEAARAKAAKEHAEKAAAAVAANVKSKTKPAGATASTGSLDDTISDTLKAIRQRSQ